MTDAVLYPVLSLVTMRSCCNGCAFAGAWLVGRYDYHGNAGFAKPNVTEAHPKVEVFHGAVQGVYVSAETSGGDTCHVLLQV